MRLRVERSWSHERRRSCCCYCCCLGAWKADAESVGEESPHSIGQSGDAFQELPHRHRAHPLHLLYMSLCYLPRLALLHWQAREAAPSVAAREEAGGSGVTTRKKRGGCCFLSRSFHSHTQEAFFRRGGFDTGTRRLKAGFHTFFWLLLARLSSQSNLRACRRLTLAALTGRAHYLARCVVSASPLAAPDCSSRHFSVRLLVLSPLPSVLMSSVEGRIGSAPTSQYISPAGGSQLSVSPSALHGSASALPASADGSNSSAYGGMETLDEPVSTTILRDLRKVAIKLKHVLIPSDTVKELRDWDLWGPLLLCLLLASTLSLSATGPQAALIFAAVFVLVWAGAGVITLNAALLGGRISTLQSVCVLGYCLAPLCIASILCHVWWNKIYHFVLVLVAFGWATRASVGFMAQLMADNRRALGVYPVLLFYAAIAWMILVQ